MQLAVSSIEIVFGVYFINTLVIFPHWFNYKKQRIYNKYFIHDHYLWDFKWVYVFPLFVLSWNRLFSYFYCFTYGWLLMSDPIMITSITTGDRGWLGTVALWHFAWNWLVSGGSLDIWPLFNARMRKNRPWEGLLVQVNLSMLCWSVKVLIKRSNGRTCCPKYLNLLFVNGCRLLHSRNSLIATLTNLRSHN